MSTVAKAIFLEVLLERQHEPAIAVRLEDILPPLFGLVSAASSIFRHPIA